MSILSSILSSAFFLVFIFSLVDQSYAHGYVHEVEVGGTTYPGWNPFSDPYASGAAKIVRKVSSDGPVPATDADIACNHQGDDGTAAIASASDGSKIVFNWNYWPSDHQGPVSTYMTSCNGDCSNFKANNARWFKIDADGYDSDTKQWAAAKLIADGASWTSTIPAGLAPGQYLIRNEIIALHSNPAQYYPSCAQVEVTGSGSGQPSESDTATMQDIYAAATFPNIYNGPITFTIPGPPVVNFGGSSGGSPSTNASATLRPTTSTKSGTPHTSASSATSLPASAPSSTTRAKQCHLKMSAGVLRRRSSRLSL